MALKVLHVLLLSTHTTLWKFLFFFHNLQDSFYLKFLRLQNQSTMEPTTAHLPRAYICSFSLVPRYRTLDGTGQLIKGQADELPHIWERYCRKTGLDIRSQTPPFCTLFHLHYAVGCHIKIPVIFIRTDRDRATQSSGQNVSGTVLTVPMLN